MRHLAHDQTYQVVELESQSAVVTVSEDLRIVGWTSGAERLTGIERGAILGRRCWEVLGLRQLDGTPICSQNCFLARSAALTADPPNARIRITGRDGERTVELSTISARLEGRRVLIHRMHLPDPSTVRDQPALTPRQLQILELLGEGITTAEIARRLVIERVTVRNHIQHVLQTLGCHSRMEAVARARRLGLI